MKFNTVKSKVLLFLSILTLLGTIFCIVSCDNFLSENLGKTTININLDLSKLIKNSRNDDTQINGYVLKLFVYDAKNYQEGDKEIENLPLLTQTSNKVDINGTVKASLEVAIDTTVIFVGKLFTLNENDIESEKPLYAGKSEVIKIQPKDNKVHLVLSRDKAEIGFEIELQEAHEHTFDENWTTSVTHHWKVATCEHTEEVSKFAEHTFSDWTTTTEPTEEEVGSKERSCDVCNYKETAEISQLAHTHKFSSDWTKDETYHWKAATCEHTSEVNEKAKHTFGEYVSNNDATTEEDGTKTRVCSVCGYEDTVTDEGSKIHEHTFATVWTYDGAYHWKAATCEHTSEVREKAKHIFDGIACIECDYEIEGFVYVKGTTITGTETWTPSSEVFVSGRQLTIPDLYVSDHEVTRGEYKEVMGTDPSTASAYDKDGNKLTGDDVLNHPVNIVSWYDALVYCNKLSIKENLTPCYTIDGSTNPDDWGTVPTSSNSTWDAATCKFEANGYRLPTDAEWEWLARGGEDYTYAGSNTVGDVAWYTSNTNSDGAREVKAKAANGYGLYDMSGNVCEWCWDWYGSISGTTAADGALSGPGRVDRGGDWSSSSDSCSVSFRYHPIPYGRVSNLGFRVVRSAVVE